MAYLNVQKINRKNILHFLLEKMPLKVKDAIGRPTEKSGGGDYADRHLVQSEYPRKVDSPWENAP